MGVTAQFVPHPNDTSPEVLKTHPGQKNCYGPANTLLQTRAFTMCLLRENIVKNNLGPGFSNINIIFFFNSLFTVKLYSHQYKSNNIIAIYNTI